MTVIDRGSYMLVDQAREIVAGRTSVWQNGDRRTVMHDDMRKWWIYKKASRRWEVHAPSVQFAPSPEANTIEPAVFETWEAAARWAWRLDVRAATVPLS